MGDDESASTISVDSETYQEIPRERKESQNVIQEATPTAGDAVVTLIDREEEIAEQLAKTNALLQQALTSIRNGKTRSSTMRKRSEECAGKLADLERQNEKHVEQYHEVLNSTQALDRVLREKQSMIESLQTMCSDLPNKNKMLQDQLDRANERSIALSNSLRDSQSLVESLSCQMHIIRSLMAETDVGAHDFPDRFETIRQFIISFMEPVDPSFFSMRSSGSNGGGGSGGGMESRGIEHLGTPGASLTSQSEYHRTPPYHNQELDAAQLAASHGEQQAPPSGMFSDYNSGCRN